MPRASIVIGAAIGGAGVALALALTSTRARADTIDTTGQPPQERCGYCHEYDGNSRMEGFPRLAGQTAGYISKQLRDFRSGKRGGTMRATAELLSDADIAAVARYFNAQTPRVATTSTTDISAGSDAGERQRAAHLHRQGDAARGIPACGSCHGAAGEGRADVPRLAGQHAAYLEAQLFAFKHGRRANDADGVMRGVVSGASESELRSLARYFASLGNS